MGNKPSNPESKQGYVPEVNSNSNNNGELTPGKMQRIADKNKRATAIEILTLQNPRLMESGNQEEIESAIEEIIASFEQPESENINPEIEKFMARMEEIQAAPNNATRAEIKKRHEAENDEEARAKMTPEQLALNDELRLMEQGVKEQGVKAGGRKRYKKTRKHRNKPKYKKTKSRRKSSRKHT